jgi:uncharacterized C2H2 Zn-finger protein
MRKYQCGTCGRTFNNHDDAYRHINNSHPGLDRVKIEPAEKD